MRNFYVFPLALVGTIITLFGLCFPVVSVSNRITIWLWGYYTVEQKSLTSSRIIYEKEFETYLRFIWMLGLLFFFFIFVFLINIIRVSIQMKKKQISMIEAKSHWDNSSTKIIGSLFMYLFFATMFLSPLEVSFKNGILIQLLGGFICAIPSFSKLKKHNYKINKYLTLKFKNHETVIYVAGKPFEICKHLIINIPVGQVNDIGSIDEAIDGYGENIDNKSYTHEAELTPKELFKGHCSNLQVWAENNYDTCLLHNNLAFPLLKQLTELGDLKALSVFKDEIRKRFRSLYAPVQQYLIYEGYLKHFSKSEKQELLEYVLNVDLWVLIGKNYFLNSQPEDAIEAYEHALKIDPINKIILKRLCKLSVIVEDYQKAIKYYKLLAEYYGLRNHDYLTLGDNYHDLCQYSNAKRMYRCILRRKEFKCKRDALLRLGDLFFSKLEIDRAKLMYWDAIELNPSDVRGWVKLSHVFHEDKKMYAAIETLKEGLKYRPHNPVLLFQFRLLFKTNRNFWEYFKFSIIYMIYKNKKRIINIFKKEEQIRNLPLRTKNNITIDFKALKEKIFGY